MGRKLIHDKFIGAYVYAITVDGVMRYIGKGRGYRAIEHLRFAKELNRRRSSGEKVKARLFYNKLAKAIRSGAKVSYKIIANNLDDAAALELEKSEIARASPMVLWNVRDGGEGTNGDIIRKLWTNPEFRAKTIAARKLKLDAAFRERARVTANDQWADPTFREKWIRQHRSLWDDPDKARARRALLKKVWNDPEKSARKSALVKSQWTPERKAAMAENRRRAWADPAFRARATASIIKASKKKPNEDQPELGLLIHSAWPAKI